MNPKLIRELECASHALGYAAGVLEGLHVMIESQAAKTTIERAMECLLTINLTQLAFRSEDET